MANTVGGLIEDTDYNSIRNKIINVLGVGVGNSGYGQVANIQSSSVSDGADITATQWANLRYDLYNTFIHQNGTTPTIVQVVKGDNIRYGAAHPNNSYNSLADNLILSRFNIGAGRFVTESLASKSSGDISWEVESYVDITYSWSTSEAARYFFNSGGQIRVTTSYSPYATTSQTTSWVNLLSSAGTRSFGAQVPSTGFSPMNGTNFFRLTNAFQTFYTATPSSPYSANRYRLQARCNVGNNSSGTANEVYIRVWLRDDYDDPRGQEPAYAPQDSVRGTLTVTTDQIRPTGPMAPSGTFTISGPSTTTIGSFIYS